MLTITDAVREAVLAHAREGRPEEVCGVLGGAYGEDASTASRTVRTRNVAPMPATTYRLDPAEQFRAMESIEADGLDVVGFYHTHPAGPDGPSATDAARATWTGYSYVIASLGGAEPSLGSWRWDGDGERFVAEELRVE